MLENTREVQYKPLNNFEIILGKIISVETSTKAEIIVK